MIARRLGMTLVIWLVWPVTYCSCQTLQAVYTSTRSVTGIAVTPDDAVIAGTRGGVLVRSSTGAWRKYTILDGLPENEVLGVSEQGGRIIAYSARGNARLQDDRWVVDPNVKPPARLTEGQICLARWKGVDYASTAEGLRMRSGDSWKSIPMPRSTGTHISALLDRGNTLWAAVFGDGVYAWNGKAWNPVRLALPERARGITAMAAAGNRLWFGTSRDGIWDYDGHRWTQHLQPDEPWDHNCQALAWYQGNLYVGTLDNGLVVRTPKGWQRIGTRDMSSNTPRQMLEFGGCLYLRQSSGVVDRFDGKTWTKNALRNLPRKQCSTLATDGTRLYVGQWGGWSETDGRTSWTHHLNIAALQGCQITALLPQAGSIWVGTQQLGLARVERAAEAVKWHNELSGMPDDTLKCLARCGDTICAGTFARGLAWMAGEAGPWTMVPEIASAQVTALEPDTAGGLYVGARTGLWRLTAAKQMKSVIGGVEVQALRLAGRDLWLGTRTGLLRLAVDPDLSP